MDVWCTRCSPPLPQKKRFEPRPALSRWIIRTSRYERGTYFEGVISYESSRFLDLLFEVPQHLHLRVTNGGPEDVQSFTSKRAGRQCRISRKATISFLQVLKSHVLPRDETAAGCIPIGPQSRPTASCAKNSTQTRPTRPYWMQTGSGSHD